MFFTVMLGVGLFCLLVVLTIDVAIWHLHQRSPERIPFGWITFWRCVRWIAVFLMVIALAIGSGNPILGLMPLMVVVVCAVAGRLRYRSELRCVNDALRLVLANGGVLPESLERLGQNMRSGLAPRLRQLGFRLRCGDSPSQAVRYTRVPLATDVVYAMSVPTPTQSLTQSAADEDERFDRSTLLQTWPARWPVASQITYLTVVVLVVYLVGLFASTFVVPTLKAIASEFGYPNGATEGQWGNMWDKLSLVRTTQYWLPWLIVIVAIWYLAGWFVSKFPSRRRTRLVPGFGPAVRQRERLFLLDAVAAAIRIGQPIDRACIAGAEATRSRLIRHWCDQLAGRVSQGQTTAIALKGAGLVSAGESRWLEAAERNGNLAHSLRLLVDDAQRVQRDLWQNRLAWLVPIVVGLAGFYVLLHAMVLFQFLADMVGYLA